MKWPFRLSRPPRIDTGAALTDFLDSESAFLAQKCATDYCWAKAGLNAQKLFAEAAFQAALNECRWESFAAVAEDATLIVEGRLRVAAARSDELGEACRRVHAAVLYRHSAPPRLARGWAGETERFAARLARAQLSPPLAAAQIAEASAKRLYDALPFHRELRRHDFDIVSNAVRFAMVAFSVKLDERLDAPATARDLLGGG
jgi:hypothetical protein